MPLTGEVKLKMASNPPPPPVAGTVWSALDGDKAKRLLAIGLPPLKAISEQCLQADRNHNPRGRTRAGEPCEGKPHARFDGGAVETG